MKIAYIALGIALCLCLTGCAQSDTSSSNTGNDGSESQRATISLSADLSYVSLDNESSGEIGAAPYPNILSDPEAEDDICLALFECELTEGSLTSVKVSGDNAYATPMNDDANFTGSASKTLLDTNLYHELCWDDETQRRDFFIALTIPLSQQDAASLAEGSRKVESQLFQDIATTLSGSEITIETQEGNGSAKQTTYRFA